MSRIWNLGGSDRNGDSGRASTALAPANPRPVAPDAYFAPGEPQDEGDSGDEIYEQYLVRPVRPIAQLATRAALWGAVALGCLGGMVGLFRSPPKTATQDVIDAALEAVNVDHGIGVPGPVAGVAERSVEAWLEADDDDHDELDALFLERPASENIDTDAITVLDVRPVAGERLSTDGYWSVTVAVDLVEQLPNQDPLPETTWYVEIGIVGDVASGLKALTTPAIVPAPRGAADQWRTAADNPEAPQTDDRLAQKVEGFLSTLLTGNGDLSLYLLPEVTMRVADPAPFVGVELLGVSYYEITKGPDKGGVRVWAVVQGTTPGGSTPIAAYELLAFKPIDRWQFRSVWGAPEVVAVPEDDEDEEEPSGPPVTATTTTEYDDGFDEDGSDDTTTTTDLSAVEGEGSGEGAGEVAPDPEG